MGQCIGRQHTTAIRHRENLPVNVNAGAAGGTNAFATLRANLSGQGQADDLAMPLSMPPEGQPIPQDTSPVRHRAHSIFALSMWHDLSAGNTAEAVRRLRALQNPEQTTLDWSHLGLTTLPPWIGQLRGLTVFDISNNALTDLPDSIGELIALKHFDISNNRLTQLPASITRLTGLQRLLAQRNQLQRLPAALNNLAALAELRVDHNQLASLPDALAIMPRLVEINAAENALTELPLALTANHIATAGATIWLQKNRLSAATIAQHGQAALAHNYHGPHFCFESELAQLSAPAANTGTPDPLSTRTPLRQLHLLLEAAAALADKREPGQPSILIGNRQLSLQDCLTRALDISLTHRRQWVPIISHHLINDLPADTARFEVLGIHLQRAHIAGWAQRQNLPVAMAVDHNAEQIQHLIAELGSQNVHRNPVLRAGRQHLDRIKQRVPLPQSINQAALAIRAHLAQIPGSDVALLGLETILPRTARITEFNESPAHALALLWTHIDNTRDPMLKANLQTSMRNKLVEISVGLCGVGMIQRVIDIPTAIDWSLTTEVPVEQLRIELQHLAAEANEEIEVLQADPDAPAVTATRYVRPAPLDLSSETIRRNIAKKPKDFAECSQLLGKAIESGQGIVEVVSRNIDIEIKSATGDSILQTLLAERITLSAGDLAKLVGHRNQHNAGQVAADEPSVAPKIAINKRYDIDSYLLASAVSLDNTRRRGDQSAPRDLTIPIFDSHSGQSKRLLLTQFRMPYVRDATSAAVLVHADELYQEHVHRNKTDTNFAGDPLVVSAGGNHRPMSLLAYREIKRAIYAELINSEPALDAALAQIDSRPPSRRKIPAPLSASQLAQLKIPLLHELNQLLEKKRIAEEKDAAATIAKRDLFRLKAHVHMVLLRGLPAELIAAEIERIFPADVQI